MNNIEVVGKDICDSDSQYIAHQCNCVTNYGKGLSKTIFTKFPYSDVYSARSRTNHRDVPGTIMIRGNGVEDRYVINMLSQFYPGRPKYGDDTLDKRKVWFGECLVKISQIPNITSISFPYNIGCGLAGGNWNEYYSVIQEFANQTGILVKLYKFK